MRKLIFQTLLVTILVIASTFFFAPQQAHAAGVLTCGTDLGCYLIGSTDIVYGIIGKIFWWVLIPLAGIVLQLLGSVIDAATKLSLDPSFYSSEAIGIAWGIVRDLANMLFIFILIYEGIKTILSIGNMGTVKRTVASVIIAALLLNFSLFFTKAMIDVSNVMTAWLVQGIENLGGSGNTSMSGAVHATLQMEKLTKTSGGTLATVGAAQSFSLQSFTQGVLLFVLTCVAIYVFFQMIFLIVGRLVAYIFLLITAPIGFTGVFLSLGDYSKQASKWWDEMLKQLMMLPMFFLMLYLTLFMVDRFDKLVFASDATSAEFTPTNYMIFVIIIMMLLKALDIAKQYSSEIGAGVAKITKGALSFAGGAVALGTIGRAANWAKDNKTLQAAAARSRTMDLALKGTAAVADSGFGLKSGYGSLSKLTGLDKVGPTKNAFKNADNYEKQRKAEKEAEEKAVARFGKGPEGEANRLAYANRLGNDVYNQSIGRLTGSRKNLAGKEGAANSIAKKASEALVKSAKDDAKKKADTKRNQLVAAKTASAIIEKQRLSNNPAEVTKAATTSQAIVSQLKKDLAQENKDDYLKFVRGFDENRAAAENRDTNNMKKISEELDTLRDLAQHLHAKDPVKHKEEIESTENKIREKSSELDRANEQIKATKLKFEELAKKITAQDRQEAAEKFVPLSEDEWKAAQEKHIKTSKEITAVIANAEALLKKATETDTAMAERKAMLAEAQNKVKDLIGDVEYKNPGKKKGVKSGKGLAYQAAKTKEEFNEKNKEMTTNENGGDKEESKPSADEGDKK